MNPALACPTTVRARPARARPERVLLGRLSAEVAPLVGALHAVCPRAQTLAARLAVAAAQGQVPDPETHRTDTAAAVAEAMREHVLRLTLDWPRLLGEPPDWSAARVAMTWVDDAVRLVGGSPETAERRVWLDGVDRILGDAVYGMRPVAWPRIDTEGRLRAWWSAGATPAARIMNALEQADMLCCLGRMGDSAGENGSHPRENTLADHDADSVAAGAFGPGSLGARFMARLAHLLTMRTALAHTLDGAPAGVAWSEAAGDNQGLSQVKVSRGLLCHRLRLSGARVAEYVIRTPSDVNFAPGGAAWQALGRVAAGRGPVNDPRAWVIAAFDACFEIPPGSLH